MVLIFSQRDFHPYLYQAIFKSIIHFREVGYLFLCTTSTIFKETLCFDLFRFIPLVFKYHLCQFLTVVKLFNRIIANPFEYKRYQQADKNCDTETDN
ncbi:Uncharacterised protein [Streptococcus pneumoniae]|nr:Uncharacterised protein [Streptococcus pneumoniae]